MFNTKGSGRGKPGAGKVYRFLAGFNRGGSGVMCKRVRGAWVVF
jgi:hypothetical protein